MQTSKQILEKERREERSNDVITRLTSSTTKGFNFDVYTNDIKEKIKYIGTISKDHTDDSCTCQSFMMGNTDLNTNLLIPFLAEAATLFVAALALAKILIRGCPCGLFCGIIVVVYLLVLHQHPACSLV